MVEGEIKVVVVPDTKILDKELKKKRTFAGLLGFGGGGDTDTGKESKKSSKKTNKLLGSMLKPIAGIFTLAILFSGLIKLLRPFVELFTALSFLVWFPLWKALKPALVGLSKLVKKTAEEGGGVSGLIRAGEKTAEEILFKNSSVINRIVAAIAVALSAVAAVLVVLAFTVGAVPALLIAAIAAIVAILILAWKPLVKLFKIITKAWQDFFNDLATAWKITIDFIKNLGANIRDKVLSSLDSIADLGIRIWNFIKSALSSFGGSIVSGIKKVGSFLNPFDDFIQRPGQGPTAFSPRDTIIGVKNPSQLFGGGGNSVTQNISIQATINNDMDIRRLAERMAELSKEELAMSTGSQRF